nr:RecName: Full=Newly excysted juvenile protein 2 [Fasciola hepatica]
LEDNGRTHWAVLVA